jgi:CysZ protein
MLTDAVRAFEEILSPQCRRIFWKMMGLSLVLVAIAWVALNQLLTGNLGLFVPTPILHDFILFMSRLGLVFILAYVIPSLAGLVAGFFLDDLADHIERNIGLDPLGTEVPLATAMKVSGIFALWSLLVNAVALLLLFVPGVNVISFTVANAFLQARQYFELAALRFHSPAEVRQLWRRHRFYLFLCGLPLAFMVAIPLFNLLTPIFGTAFMVRVHARITNLRTVTIA